MAPAMTSASAPTQLFFSPSVLAWHFFLDTVTSRLRVCSPSNSSGSPVFCMWCLDSSLRSTCWCRSNTLVVSYSCSSPASRRSASTRGFLAFHSACSSCRLSSMSRASSDTSTWSRSSVACSRQHSARSSASRSLRSTSSTSLATTRTAALVDVARPRSSDCSSSSLSLATGLPNGSRTLSTPPSQVYTVRGTLRRRTHPRELRAVRPSVRSRTASAPSV